MKRPKLVGKVQTVLGIVDPDCLGVTMPHEHLVSDLSAWFVEPVTAADRGMAHEPIRLDNLYWVKTHPAGHADNVKLMDEQVAIKEALLFKQAGGGTIVELSNNGLCRDPLALARIARATGLNVVMGAGYYIAGSHPPELVTKSVEEIAEEIIRDITVGVDDNGVRAGIIGEIGCSVPLDDTEVKVLQASAVAQRRTGAGLNIHPSPRDDLALKNIEILTDAGADLSRTVIDHVDCWGFSPTTKRKLLDAGFYIEYDTFGYEGVFLPLQGQVLEQTGIDDTQIVEEIIQLAADGYLNQILVSQDICFKQLLTTYGGYGYAHIMRDMVPVMRYKGMSEDQIHTLLVENPKRLLTFAEPKE